MDAQFNIEVSQEERHLIEHKDSVGYLEQGSFAYYNYFSSRAGSMFVTLTTQNKKCANIYLAKGTGVRASGSNYVAKTSGNDLFYEAEKGMYSITLEATNNCHYSISASSSAYRVYELTPGVHKDVKLEQNEYAYFFYHHTHNASFKIMSLEDYGEVLISVNETSKIIMEEFEKQT